MSNLTIKARNGRLAAIQALGGRRHSDRGFRAERLARACASLETAAPVSSMRNIFAC